MKEREVRYYDSFTDDFEYTANQDFELPENYKWIRNGFFAKILSALIYAAALLFSSIYCKFFLHMKVTGRKNLKKVKGGYFIFANHTQPLGDVFIPALCAFPKRIYTLVGTANYGIPVIGKLLTYLGALPIVNTVNGLKQLNKAMEYRLKHGHPVTIYPEAHVWEYYTQIRPFNSTSFKFPAKLNFPSFAMTVTYKKSKLFKKPVMEVFVDGPFYPCKNSLKENAEYLNTEIFSVMTKRSKNSNFEYIKYKKKPMTD
ncbi:MAG: lysophospholipid acyltransferase family protein [Acutalibacteraceae bacterium]|nr:lysophospholipid acyltransferase family protein [Acutalibacteraceae bacterium]